jgi:hypothetical protein
MDRSWAIEGSQNVFDKQSTAICSLLTEPRTSKVNCTAENEDAFQNVTKWANQG